MAYRSELFSPYFSIWWGFQLRFRAIDMFLIDFTPFLCCTALYYIAEFYSNVTGVVVPREKYGKKFCFEFTFLFVLSMHACCTLTESHVYMVFDLRAKKGEIVDEWLKGSINHENPKCNSLSLLLSWFPGYRISVFFFQSERDDAEQPETQLICWTFDRQHNVYFYILLNPSPDIPK